VKAVPSGPSSISATRKMRCRKTIITWIRTIRRPAQAAVRPITLAIVSSPRTQFHRNSRFQNMPSAVMTRKVVKMTKKNSTDAP
jgi:hypothetical protein